MALTADTVLVSPGYLDKHSRQIKGTFNLAVGASLSLNLVTILTAAEAAKYDMANVTIETWIVDPEQGSPTVGYLVSGNAVIAAGFKATGEVILNNSYVSSLTGTYRITVRMK